MSGRIIRPEQAEGINGIPVIGKLHIGMKNEKGYPMSIDYFRATGKYAELFTKALGDKPSEIQIIFPSDSAELTCNERYIYRDSAGALVAWGDGQTFHLWDGKMYRPISVEKSPNVMDWVTEHYPTKRGAENWDIELTMRFIIPAIQGVVGVWALTTKGAASSIHNLRDSFDAVQRLRGSVMTSVFDLSVHFHKSNKPGQSSRYPVLELVCNDNRVGQVQEMLQQKNSVKSLLTEK